MAIKETEIRIGNLIQHNNGKMITMDMRLMYAHCGGNLDYNLDQYNAIPLTEEWLLKFGFEKNIKYENFVKEISQCKEFILAFSKDTNSWFLCDTDVDTNIKFVHQLQNLYFALTEKELEIK